MTKVAKGTNSSSDPIPPTTLCLFGADTSWWTVPVNRPKGPLDDLIVQKGASCGRIEWTSVLEDWRDGCTSVTPPSLALRKVKMNTFTLLRAAVK